MNQFMKEAIKLADDNLITNAGGPFGAVIVKNNQIIGRGNNNVIKNNDPTAHAEIMAIRDACKKLNTYDLRDCILFTSCYPCPMCLSAIIWSNIKTVYFGNTKEDAADIGFRDKTIYDFLDALGNGKESSILKLLNIDRADTIKSFEKFNDKDDKVIY